MELSRRSFIRWVLASGAAMGCPIPAGAESKDAADGSAIPAAHLRSEDYSVCHKVRDGESFAMPRPDQRCDVVIIGGGPSGLAAADELKTSDFLLLEKEDHVGGNSFSESWEG